MMTLAASALLVCLEAEMFSNKRSAAVRVALVRDGMLIDERVVQTGSVTIGPGTNATLTDPTLDSRRSVIVERRGRWSVAEGASGGWVQTGADRVDISGQPVLLSTSSHGVIRVDGATKVLVRSLPRRPTRGLTRRGRTSLSLAAILLTVTLVVGGGGVSLDLWWRLTGQYLAPQTAHAAMRYESLKIEVAREPAEPVEQETPEVAADTPIVELEPEETVVTVEPTLVRESPPVKLDPMPAKPARIALPPRKRSTPNRAPTRVKRAPKQVVATASSVRQKTILVALNSSTRGSASDLALATGGTSQRIASAFSGTDGGVTSTQRTLVPAGPSRQAARRGYAKQTPTKRRLKTRQVTTAAQTERKVRTRVSLVGKPKPKPGSGVVDRSAVASVFKRRQGALRTCYERQIRVDASLRGKLTLKFTIGSAGRVTAISTPSDSLNSPKVAHCIVNKVKGWRFPRPKGGPATFSYPMLFTSQMTAKSR